ncbi:hypothetical protein HQ535_15940 [bacterium]|nr:hypothetical protein [bacterium]
MSRPHPGIGDTPGVHDLVNHKCLVIIEQVGKDSLLMGGPSEDSAVSLNAPVEERLCDVMGIRGASSRGAAGWRSLSRMCWV